MKECVFQGVSYREGDVLLFSSSDSAVKEGTVRFGIYDDAEGWDVVEHLGFYVEYEFGNPVQLGDITLPDCIKRMNGKKIVNK